MAATGYGQNADLSRVAKQGDTMSGPLILSGDPTTQLGAATKEYADLLVVPPFLGLLANTGVLSGGQMSVHAGNPLAFDLAKTYAYTADYTNPLSPNVVPVTIPAQTVVLSGASLTRQLNWWVSDSSGTISSMPQRPTEAQRRTLIQLGATFSSTPTSAINVIQTIPELINQTPNQLYDLMNALGMFSVSGNQVSANGANLSFNKSVGEIFAAGFNYATSASDPHTLVNPAETPVTFRRCTQLTSSFGAFVNSIDVLNYDVGGVITPIPNPTSSATIHRVWLTGTGQTQTQVVVQYGQTVYANLAAAQAVLGSTNFVLNPDLGGGSNVTLLAWIVAQKNCLSLQDTTTSAIVLAHKFANP